MSDLVRRCFPLVFSDAAPLLRTRAFELMLLLLGERADSCFMAPKLRIGKGFAPISPSFNVFQVLSLSGGFVLSRGVSLLFLFRDAEA